MFARQRMPQEIKPGEEGVIYAGNALLCGGECVFIQFPNNLLA